MIKFKEMANKNSRWDCKCSCGKRTVAYGCHLKSGKMLSCGCLRAEISSEVNKTHGRSRTPTHIVWKGINQRCNDEGCVSFKNYGGRGIKVCKRWRKFENFLADMGERPKGMTIERRDNNGHYCKKNCRWATKKDQANNMRSNRFIESNGKRLTVSQWEDFKGVRRGLFHCRLGKGWDELRAISAKPK